MWIVWLEQNRHSFEDNEKTLDELKERNRHSFEDNEKTLDELKVLL